MHVTYNSDENELHYNIERDITNQTILVYFFVKLSDVLSCLRRRRSNQRFTKLYTEEVISYNLTRWGQFWNNQ